MKDKERPAESPAARRPHRYIVGRPAGGEPPPNVSPADALAVLAKNFPYVYILGSSQDVPADVVIFARQAELLSEVLSPDAAEAIRLSK